MPSGLGRGLSSLIPPKVTKVTTPEGEAIVDVSSSSDKDKILRVPPNRISVNPMQPRKEFNETQLNDLMESIKVYGIIQPLVVTKRGENFELIAGERRLRASKLLGLDEVPVIVREAKEQEKLELALIENIQREDLNPIETALAYRKLIDEFSLTQEVLARRVGKSRPVVANSLRLLNLPEEIQDGLMKGLINEGHAKLIAGLEGEARQMALYRKILHGGLSVSDTIKESRSMGGTKAARIKLNLPDKERENTLQQFFSTKVEIKRKGTGGQIIINFFSDEELEEMMKKVGK